MLCCAVWIEKYYKWREIRIADCFSFISTKGKGKGTGREGKGRKGEGRKRVKGSRGRGVEGSRNKMGGKILDFSSKRGEHSLKYSTES